MSRTGEMRSAYTGSVGKPEGKRQFGSPRRRWKDNVKYMLKK